jgi:GNAT superfamily N-acetyltransferase
MRRATARDIPRLSAALASAFFDDPAQRWLFPDDGKRLEQGTRLFEILSGMEMGQQAWVGGAMEGGAVWFPPGAWPIGAAAAARRAPLLLRLLGRRAPFALMGLARVESKHPGEPHWYLANIGTRPESRRRGIASALMGKVLDQADAVGSPVYLDAATADNASFFERRGFDTIGEMSLLRGPRLYLMLRQPQ